MEITSQDPNLALKEFNTKIQEMEENRKQPSTASIIFWLILFPPVALYKMWKYQKFHIWFPNLMIILALLNFPSLLTINTPLPDLGLNYTPISTTPYFIAIIIISVVEIVLGFYLRKKVQKEGSLSSLSMLLCLFLMFVQYIPLIFMVTNTLSSILSQTPTLNELEF